MAQATCSEGMAAYSLAWEAKAPVLHAPMAWVTDTMSTKPTAASIRGGATGYSQNTAKPMRLVPMRVLRSIR